MNKFKPGDKVRALSNSPSGGYIQGQIYEVSEQDKTTVFTVLDSQGSSSNGWRETNFELVTEDSVKQIKVGDKIRILQDRFHCASVSRGDILTVTSISGYGTFETSRWTFQLHHLGEGFELVTDTGTELEQLVATANAGLKALNELRHKHRSRVETYNVKLDQTATISDGGPTEIFTVLFKSLAASYNDGSYVLRVKPDAPKFEPFVVGSGWVVEMDGKHHVKIGCQKFIASEFLRVCAELLTGSHEVIIDAGIFHAYRDGLKFKSHRLEWREVEQIETALKKAV